MRTLKQSATIIAKVLKEINDTRNRTNSEFITEICLKHDINEKHIRDVGLLNYTEYGCKIKELR
jgi:hypothetical protein